MAHAGKKVVLCPVQFLNFFFLLLGQLIFLFVNPVQKHQQHAGQQTHHDYGIGGVKKRMSRRIARNRCRKIECNVVAQQRLCRTKDEKRCLPPSLQGNAYINEAEHKPFRHTAVKPACREKADREQHKEHHRNGCCPRINALLPDAELHDHCHNDETDRQQQPIYNTPAHGQYKNQCKHTNA